MNSIQGQIDQALDKIDLILKGEDFSAYHQVKELLISSKNEIENQSIESAKKKLLTSIRLIIEAPPENESLGLSCLKEIDRIYKSL